MLTSFCPRARGTVLFLAALALATSAVARDAFVMLSGGASPMTNNYSQYLQARPVTKFFQDSYPADSVWTFFGAGNVEGEAPVFADVRMQYKKDGLVLESWVPGPLPRNRPAKRGAAQGVSRGDTPRGERGRHALPVRG